jgi:hypothetical protein
MEEFCNAELKADTIIIQTRHKIIHYLNINSKKPGNIYMPLHKNTVTEKEE